jgi:prevent-host-death family protein
MEVGIRELRSDLRRWLDEVKAGREIVITERGKPVARLVSVTSLTRLERLIEEGVITMPRRPAQRAEGMKRIRPRGSVSELIKEQRR